METCSATNEIVKIELKTGSWAIGKLHNSSGYYQIDIIDPITPKINTEKPFIQAISIENQSTYFFHEFSTAQNSIYPRFIVQTEEVVFEKFEIEFPHMENWMQSCFEPTDLHSGKSSKINNEMLIEEKINFNDKKITIKSEPYITNTATLQPQKIYHTIKFSISAEPQKLALEDITTISIHLSTLFTGLVGAPIGIKEIHMIDSGHKRSKLLFNNPRADTCQIPPKSAIINYNQAINENIFKDILEKWFSEKQSKNRKIFSRLYGILTYNGFWPEKVVIIISTIEAIIKAAPSIAKLSRAKQKEFRRIKDELKNFAHTLTPEACFIEEWTIAFPNLEAYINDFSAKKSPTLSEKLNELLQNTPPDIRNSIKLDIKELEMLKDIRDSAAHARDDTALDQFNECIAPSHKAIILIIYLMLRELGISDSLFLNGGIRTRSSELTRAAFSSWAQVN